MWRLVLQETELQNLLHKKLLNLGEFTKNFFYETSSTEDAECSEHPCLHEFA